jgi:hypothetical protein
MTWPAPGRDKTVAANKISRAKFSPRRSTCFFDLGLADAVSAGLVVMGLFLSQDGLVFANLETAQTAFTFFRLVNAGMTVEDEIHFSENMLWADIHTGPTGFAAAGIQADISGFYLMLKGCLIFHFLFLYP